MKRRNFIKLTSTASAAGLLPIQLNTSFKFLNNFSNCDFSNRKIVLIELAGGNDGLNTVIPLDVYSDYVQKQEIHQVEQEKKEKSESDEIAEDVDINIESFEKEIESPN